MDSEPIAPLTPGPHVLVEVQFEPDLLSRETYRVYELTFGEWFPTYSYGFAGQRHFRTREQIESLVDSQNHLVDYRTPYRVAVMSDGSYVGHFKYEEDFTAWIRSYMRGHVIETVREDEESA